jgi:hypothetical protein
MNGATEYHALLCIRERVWGEVGATLRRLGKVDFVGAGGQEPAGVQDARLDGAASLGKDYLGECGKIPVDLRVSLYFPGGNSRKN